MGVRDRVLDLLLPLMCVSCRRDLPPPCRGPLCGACVSALHPLRAPPCSRCGVPDGSPEGRCRRCRGSLFAVDRIRGAFPYRAPVTHLLHAFKYGGRLSVGRALGDWMAGLLPRAEELRGADVLTPVPLHPRRLRERGFNQAEVLARAVARVSGRPVADALERPRATAPQWGLGVSDRARNLTGAFRPRPGARVRGLAVLLIDDVCTSGSTLEACGRALQEAGAASVSAYVLARD